MSIKTKSKKTTKANPPIAKLKQGPITAAIWRQSSTNGEFYTVTFERTYMAKSNEFKTSHSFRLDDLEKLTELAAQAHSEILDRMGG